MSKADTFDFPKTKVYSGLSLTIDDVKRELPFAEFSGPIQRGDLLKDIDNGYQLIALVDGNFYQSLAASPSELMDAIRCGLKIYGSSSMGALRAVELEPFGMVGFGKVFEHIRDTPFFRDDFVGQAYGEGEGISFSTVPYIDLHFGLERAVERGEADPELARVLLSVYGEIYFPRRTKAELIFELKRRYAGREDLVSLAMSIFENGFSQKHEDAIGLLRKISSDLEETRSINQRLWSLQSSSRCDQELIR